MRISAYADHPHEPHGSATAWPSLMLSQLLLLCVHTFVQYKLVNWFYKGKSENCELQKFTNTKFCCESLQIQRSVAKICNCALYESFGCILAAHKSLPPCHIGIWNWKGLTCNQIYWTQRRADLWLCNCSVSSAQYFCSQYFLWSRVFLWNQISSNPNQEFQLN